MNDPKLKRTSVVVKYGADDGYNFVCECEGQYD